MHSRVGDLIEPALAGMGYELVYVENINHGRPLRIYIDKSGGITVDDCAHVSQHVARLLSVEGVDYERLEVSSPGLDRPLRGPQDFDRFAGERARIKVLHRINGRGNFTGILRGMDGERLRLEVDGEAMLIEASNIDKARLAPQF